VIPSELKAELDTRIAELKEILEKDPENTSRIQPASASLVESLQKVGSAVYGAQQAAASNGAYEEPAGEAAGAAEDDEATVEGEFREV
jgi:molecular chaperone DnaK